MCFKTCNKKSYITFIKITNIYFAFDFSIWYDITYIKHVHIILFNKHHKTGFVLKLYFTIQ